MPESKGERLWLSDRLRAWFKLQLLVVTSTCCFSFTLSWGSDAQGNALEVSEARFWWYREAARAGTSSTAVHYDVYSHLPFP